MQPCRTPETISKNSVYPLAVLTQQLELSYSALKILINHEPVKNAVVCQNFLQEWPVYTVKGLVDTVNFVQ